MTAFGVVGCIWLLCLSRHCASSVFVSQALHGVVLSTYALQVPRESDQVNVQIENIKVMLPAQPPARR